MLNYNTIGIMSGTSLDGIDVVYVEFSYEKNWNFNIKKATTFPFDNLWADKLSSANKLSRLKITQLHKDFGLLLAEKVNFFINEYGINKNKIDLIASHGHTVFHQPENKITLQIGCGIEISKKTNVKTVCDFRSLDVAHGGQGAPLVPIGDLLLFSSHEYCLNIGGIANISFDEENRRIAGDIDFANINSNCLSKKLGFKWDENGNLARQGRLNKSLLEKLNQLSFYKSDFPKSLGIEDYFRWYEPVIDDFNISILDKLHTTGIHLCKNIKKVLGNGINTNLLVTGGGAYNSFWIENLSKQGVNTVIPSKEIIEFKEALIFAFLGVLRVRNEINTLASVTGATKDLISGILYDPKKF